MTNTQIIFNESMKLMEQGIIKPSGRVIEIRKPDGTTEAIAEPESIHTFQAWKQLGFSVKKGQKAVASFTIWKHTSKKVEVEGEEVDVNKMFLKKASFFTAEQVEAITA